MQPSSPPRRCDSNQEPSSKPGAIHYGATRRVTLAQGFHGRAGAFFGQFRDQAFTGDASGVCQGCCRLYYATSCLFD